MMRDDDPMMNRRVLAITLGCDLIGAVSDGLADLGAKVARLDGGFDGSSRESVAALVNGAVEAHGIPELVILSAIPERAMQAEPVAATAQSDWRAIVLDGFRATVWLLQALGAHMKSSGGAVVFVAPSLSLVGAPGLVGLSTLLEGQRGLMKSVARQWGSSGVTLNWIAASPRALAPFEGVSLAARPDAASVALGRAPDPRTELPPLLGFLCTKGGRAITGATLMVDGGEWMVP